jgi:acyl-CoA reductase-like NAD-dependent aldehyde dehydrogenase
MKSINPATEQVLRDYPETTEAELGKRLEIAEQAFAS